MLEPRKRRFLAELFAGNLSEKAVLERMKIKPETFAGWLRDVEFATAIEEKIELANLSSRLLIARSKPAAAKTLIELTRSDKEETARKACLDVIGFEDAKAGSKRPSHEASFEIEAEKAERILRILAE